MSKSSIKLIRRRRSVLNMWKSNKISSRLLKKPSALAANRSLTI